MRCVQTQAMRVLVACEFSGTVREAFRRRGHDAWSCDLLPADDSQDYHIEDDVLRYLDSDWDLMIAHPPCTYLTVSGLHWNKRRPERAALTEEAIEFVQALLRANIPRIALENPIGILSSRIRKPDQIIQPYQFGHDASKSTCLWLKGLPPLQPTEFVPPRVVGGKPRWDNQTDSGQNRLGPSPDRWKLRSITYQGVAEAMAEQWGTV
jgi:site-specific DNA-cytosine methylase